MSLIYKIQQGGEAPNLYTFYGDQYEYNDLRRAYDEGLNSYLNKYKGKYRDELQQAGDNLMSGIKDGTITFEDGKYHDSQGRYTNDSNVKKDFYGIMANYIYGLQNKANKYSKPEDPNKIKYSGKSSLGKALLRNIFNGDDYDPESFMYLSPDSKIQNILSGTQYIMNNYDTLFSDSSEQQKADDLKNLSNVIKSIKDKNVSDDDYFILSKTFGNNIKWRDLFVNKKQLEEEQAALQNQAAIQKENQTLKQSFLQYLNDKYPVTQNNIQEYSTDVYLNQNQINAINNYLNQYDSRYLRSAVNYGLNNPEEVHQISDRQYVTWRILAIFALNKLIDNKEFVRDENNPNIIYIKGLIDKSKNVGYYLNKDTKKIYSADLRKIPYYRKRLWEEFNSQTESDWIDDLIASRKKGGILYAKKGSEIPFYHGLTEYAYSDKDLVWNTDKLWSINKDGIYGEAHINDKSGNDPSRYVGSEESTEDVIKIQGLQDYINFGKALFNSDGSLSDVGRAWAKAYDAGLPEGSLATIFDKNNEIRGSWEPKNNDTLGRSPQKFDDVKKYIEYIRNDNIGGRAHDIFKRRGKRLFYKDGQGNKHYVNPEFFKDKKYKISKDPVASDDLWDDYEITGLTSDINLNDYQRKNPINLESKLQKIAPDIISAGRVLATLRHNNRNAKLLQDTLLPRLHDTYELYSPVTGNYGEMQLRNRQAAELRRMGSQPLTSDARLQLARQDQANSQSRDLEYQGFLADDKEIRRTMEEALKRSEDNIARRTKLANDNRDELHDYSMQRAKIEATRRKENHDTIDEYMKELYNNIKNKNDEKESINKQINSSLLQRYYEDAVRSVDKAYEEKHPNATYETKLADNNYIDAIRKLRRKLQYDTLQTYINPSITIDYEDPGSYEDILKSIKF